MIILGVDFMDYDLEGFIWGGILLFYSDGGIVDLDCDINLVIDWSSWVQEVCIVFVNLEYQFDSGWYGKFVYIYQENNYDV